MGRVENKKIEKKFKRFFKTCAFIQIILLICGLLAVDLQIRTILGIDEVGLILYKQAEDGKHTVHIMGNSHFVDTSTIKIQTHNKLTQLKGKVRGIGEEIKQKFKNIWY